jgi:hypothetical protein
LEEWAVLVSWIDTFIWNLLGSRVADSCHHFVCLPPTSLRLARLS